MKFRVASVLGGLAAVLLVAGGGAPALASNVYVYGHETVANQALLSLSESVAVGDEAAALASLDLTVLQDLSTDETRTFLVELDPFVSATMQLINLRASELVANADPNYVLFSAAADEVSYSNGSLWGMLGAGTSPASTYGSNAGAAWATSTGSSDVYVAVLDSGIDPSHPDLAANVVGSLGYDFVNDDASFFDADEHDHGTHVAGIIGAIGNNGEGVAGVSWNTKLIPVKMIGSDGEGSTADAFAAINYVTELRTKQGIDIIAINASWGGGGYVEDMEKAIQRAGDAGIVFVAAAGNESRNIDSEPENQPQSFPAKYDCTTDARDWDCIVSVASISADGSLSGFSNFSETQVDIAAPGAEILSTLPVADGSYGVLSGTSMATPHVTGAIALCVSSYRGTSAEAAVSKLYATAAPTASMAGKVATGGRLDVAAMVASCAGDTAAFSGRHSDVFASAIYTDRIRLDWSDSVIGDFEQEIQIASGPTACTGTFSHYAWIGPGLTSYPIEGLEESEFYCFRIRSNNMATNSAFTSSNVSITWTSNLPFVTGKVLLSDGTPVANAPVKWSGSGQASFAALGATVRTDASGNYVTQVSDGTPGTFSVEMPISAVNGKNLTEPAIPWGLVANGTTTIDDDIELDFTLPEQHDITFRVTADGAPLADAVVHFGELAKYCLRDSYQPFAGAADSSCRVWPTGASGSRLKTNAQGELTLPFLAGSYFSNPVHKIAIIDSNNLGRVQTIELSPSADEVIDIALPETSLLTGKVLLDDDTTPVAGAPVYWRPDSQWKDSGNSNVYRVVTDSAGNFSFDVAQGTAAELYVATPISANSGSPTTPRIPWGLHAGGMLTISSDTNKNLVLPEQHVVTLAVTEFETSDALEGAKAQYGALAEYCVRGTYSAFTGATDSTCRFWATGVSSSPVRTNSSGQVSFAVLDDSYFRTPRDRKFSVQHPTLTSRVATVEIAVSDDTTIGVEMPGPVTISGVVMMADGTVVSGAPISWVADSQWSANGYSSASTVSAADGSYTLTVSTGTPGELFVETSRSARNGPVGSPQLPWGLRAGGRLTATSDIVVDFKLPEQSVATFEVREMSDFGPGEPVVGASIRYQELAQYCIRGSYLPFSGAGEGSCQYWPVGYSSSPPVTDSNGQATVPLIDPQYFRVNNYSFSVIHPMDVARAKNVTVTSTGDDQQVDVVMPGTPSKPSMPTAVAGEGSVTLTWTEPWNGGAFIDYYEVWVALDAQGPYERLTSGSCAGQIAPELRSCEVTGLTPGVTYYFAIIAKNVVGFSDLGFAATAVPLAATLDFALSPAPSVSGSMVVGQSLTAQTGEWDAGVSFSYQWRRDGVAIDGANDSTYQLVAADVGAEITVSVTGSKAGYNSVTRVSAAGTAVTAGTLTLTPTPSLSGTVEVGEVLTANAGQWDAGVTLAYQWLRAGVEISGATASSYTIVETDVGAALSVRVTGSRLGYLSVGRVSAGTETVAEVIEVTSVGTQTLTPQPTLEGEPTVGETLVATVGDWDAGVSLSYRWLRNGSGIGGATGTSYTLRPSDAGSVISFEVTSSKADYVTVVEVSDGVGPIVVLQIETLEPPRLLLTPTPVLNGSARVGQTLTAVVGSWDDGALLSYQWYRDGVAIFGETGATYLIKAADLGAEISFEVAGSITGLDFERRMSLATDAVLAAEVAGNDGGGFGGGGFVMPPSPIALPALNRALPSGTSNAVFAADGRVLDAAVTVAAGGRGLALAGSGWRISVGAESGLSVGASGAAELASGSRVEFRASGYEPGSVVQAYLVPKTYLQLAAFDWRLATVAAEPIDLGSTEVSATGEFELAVVPRAAAGEYQLQLVGTTALGEVVTMALQAQVSGATGVARGWTRAFDDGTLKFYARDLVGSGKVRFMLNGREVAWVRAVDATDPRLNVGPAAARDGLVRTVGPGSRWSLAAGRNVLEIYVGENRLVRRIFTQ